MEFLEKDLEQIIYETENHILWDKGLHIFGSKKRQLKIGNYGISDIISIERPNFPNDPLIITIYELKKNKICIKAFLQSIRYAKGIRRYISNRKPKLKFEIHICLIGSELDLISSFSYLIDFVDNLSILTYSFDANDIKFKRHYSYSLIKEGFYGK